MAEFNCGACPRRGEAPRGTILAYPRLDVWSRLKFKFLIFLAPYVLVWPITNALSGWTVAPRTSKCASKHATYPSSPIPILDDLFKPHSIDSPSVYDGNWAEAERVLQLVADAGPFGTVACEALGRGWALSLQNDSSLCSAFAGHKHKRMVLKNLYYTHGVIQITLRRTTAEPGRTVPGSNDKS
ncbi:hypothetical protein DFH94DRAFT_802572 [Russula ochroleuca]|uniref:Uncharacterized protein n=1 Tax=Russula ochroleuca TaxID=152965 RepID=A0A9P5JTY5_9AGAM|nr:hypothetical protein DFH94DRAFT_802572 [Russula ochroleuca]